MLQRPFSFFLWSIRLAAFMAGLLLVSGNVAGQPLALTVGTTATTCGMSDGAITAIVSGGQAPYTITDGLTTNSTGNFSGLAANQYEVTVTDNLGASISKNVFVGNGCIKVTTKVQDATCGNASGTLTVTVAGGSGSYTYSIDDGTSYFASNVFNAVAAGIYTVVVQDEILGTVATTMASVNNLLGATITATNVSAASCMNDDGTVGVTASGGTPPLFYSINGGAFGSTADFSSVGSGPATVTVKDGNGCLTTAAVTVPLNNNLTLTVGPTAKICQGTGTTLPVTSNAASFAWTPADGLSNTSVATPVAQPSTTTTYDVTATLGVCAQSGSVTVTVFPAPTASAGPADTICYGKSASLQGSGGVTYLWQPSTFLSDSTIADPVVEQPTSSINYSLTVYGTDGCASIERVTELVYVTPPPAVFAGDDTAVLSGQLLDLNAIDVNNSGFTSYQWSPALGLNDAFVQDPVAQITGSITYTVLATTAAGCSNTASITIDAARYSDIVVPNAFTPNHDGHNDILRVDAIGIKDFRYFSVYNRWGQEVFTTANQGLGWDGMRGGQVEQAGVYVWAAMGVDFSGKAVMRKGTVILIR